VKKARPEIARFRLLLLLFLELTVSWVLYEKRSFVHSSAYSAIACSVLLIHRHNALFFSRALVQGPSLLSSNPSKSLAFDDRSRSKHILRISAVAVTVIRLETLYIAADASQRHHTRVLDILCDWCFKKLGSSPVEAVA